MTEDPERLREMRRNIDERLAQAVRPPGSLLQKSVNDPDLYLSEEEKRNRETAAYSARREEKERAAAEHEIRALVSPLSDEQLRGILDGRLTMDHQTVQEHFGGRLVERDEAEERARDAVRAELRRRAQREQQNAEASVTASLPFVSKGDIRPVVPWIALLVGLILLATGGSDDQKEEIEVEERVERH